MFLKWVCNPSNPANFLTSPTSRFLRFPHQILSDLDSNDIRGSSAPNWTFLCSPEHFLQVVPAPHRKFIRVPLLNIQNILVFFFFFPPPEPAVTPFFFLLTIKFCGLYLCNKVWCCCVSSQDDYFKSWVPARSPGQGESFQMKFCPRVFHHWRYILGQFLFSEPSHNK